VIPPPPRPRPPPVDYYELGRQAALAAQPASCGQAVEECEEVPGCGAPRTTPAPGYYLAGYLYYGDPNQPKPILQPMPGCGQAPVAYPAPMGGQQPTSVEFEIDEYGPPYGEQGYGMDAYSAQTGGYPMGY